MRHGGGQHPEGCFRTAALGVELLPHELLHLTLSAVPQVGTAVTPPLQMGD